MMVSSRVYGMPSRLWSCWLFSYQKRDRGVAFLLPSWGICIIKSAFAKQGKQLTIRLRQPCQNPNDMVTSAREIQQMPIRGACFVRGMGTRVWTAHLRMLSDNE
jgi:hypothetical protein